MVSPVSTNDPAFVEQRLGSGTADISQQQAMTFTQLEMGLISGAQLAKQCINSVQMSSVLEKWVSAIQARQPLCLRSPQLYR